MSSIFDNCQAASIGAQNCPCRYCSYINAMPDINFPPGYPERFKDLRAVKFLQQEDKVSGHDVLLHGQSPKLDELEVAKGDLEAKTTALDAKFKDVDATTNTLDTRSQNLNNQILSNTGDITTIKNQLTTLLTEVNSNASEIANIKAFTRYVPPKG